MELCYDGGLVMPRNYALMSEDEMTYVEGGGWIAWAFAMTGGVAAATAGAILGFAGGAALGTVVLPFFGTVSVGAICAVAGGAAAFSAGFMSAYDFGRFLEKRFLGWY